MELLAEILIGKLHREGYTKNEAREEFNRLSEASGYTGWNPELFDEVCESLNYW